MTEKRKCVRLARMMRDGAPCSEEEASSDKAFEVRKRILRRPCECGKMGNILISADIDLDTEKVIRWEMPFTENDVETATSLQQKTVWKDVKYCPFCGRMLRVE